MARANTRAQFQKKHLIDSQKSKTNSHIAKRPMLAHNLSKKKSLKKKPQLKAARRRGTRHNQKTPKKTKKIHHKAQHRRVICANCLFVNAKKQKKTPQGPASERYPSEHPFLRLIVRDRLAPRHTPLWAASAQTTVFIFYKKLCIYIYIRFRTCWMESFLPRRAMEKIIHTYIYIYIYI